MEGGPRAIDDGRYCQVIEEQRKKDVRVVLVIVVCWTGEWKGPQSSPRHAMNEGRERLLSSLFCGRIGGKERKEMASSPGQQKGEWIRHLNHRSCRFLSHGEEGREKKWHHRRVEWKKRMNTSSCPSLLPFLVALSSSAYRLVAHCPLLELITPRSSPIPQPSVNHHSIPIALSSIARSHRRRRHRWTMLPFLASPALRPRDCQNCRLEPANPS